MESAAHEVCGYKLFRLLANFVTIQNGESLTGGRYPTLRAMLDSGRKLFAVLMEALTWTGRNMVNTSMAVNTNISRCQSAITMFAQPSILTMLGGGRVRAPLTLA